LSQSTYEYDRELPAYQIVNLRLGAKTDQWNTALFINNAADEKAILSLDTERDGRGRVAYHVNQPRTIGLSARYDF